MPGCAIEEIFEPIVRLLDDGLPAELSAARPPGPRRQARAASASWVRRAPGARPRISGAATTRWTAVAALLRRLIALAPRRARRRSTSQDRRVVDGLLPSRASRGSRRCRAAVRRAGRAGTMVHDATRCTASTASRRFAAMCCTSSSVNEKARHAHDHPPHDADPVVLADRDATHGCSSRWPRFTRDYDVTTCGYGPAPDGVVEHIQHPGRPEVQRPGRQADHPEALPPGVLAALRRQLVARAPDAGAASTSPSRMTSRRCPSR